MIGWFLSGQFSRNLAKNDENCLTYAKATYAKAYHFMAILKSFLISIYQIVNCLKILFIVFLFLLLYLAKVAHCAKVNNNKKILKSIESCN